MANRFLQSLLGEEDFEQAQGQARNNALLMAGLQGLLASGPSPTPVGFGQVLGQAGMAGVGAYDESMQQFGQQGLQSMELDRFRQEQADLERQREADEAFGLAAQEIMAGGRVDYNKLQQLATAFPERAGPLINALQAARPPEAPRADLQFDPNTGTVFNRRTGEVTMAEGFVPLTGPQAGLVLGEELNQQIGREAFDPNKVYQRNDKGQVSPVDTGNLNAAELEQAANPIIQQFNQSTNQLTPRIIAADSALDSLERANDFAVRGAVTSWLSAMGVRPRGEDGLYEESGAYSELLRVINQTAGGGPITQQQRQQIATEVRSIKNRLEQEVETERKTTRKRLENLGFPQSYIDTITRAGAAPMSPTDLAAQARAERERRQGGR
jgi:hypothetical protein